MYQLKAATSLFNSFKNFKKLKKLKKPKTPGRIKSERFRFLMKK
jgi:hypothetical protein